jgi:hypothetical protein
MPISPPKAYSNEAFLNSRDGRALRILAEYLEPKSRFDRENVDDTIVRSTAPRPTANRAANSLRCKWR